MISFQKRLHLPSLPILKRSALYSISVTLITAYLLLTSSLTLASPLTPNPATAESCPAGYVKGNLTASDYTKLITSRTSSTSQAITGTNSVAIPLNIKVTKQDTGTGAVVENSFSAFTNAGFSGLFVWQTFGLKPAKSEITLEFFNSNSNEPMYLTDFAMSAFDIDTGSFDDYLAFRGFSKDNNSLPPTNRTSNSQINEITTAPTTGIIFPGYNTKSGGTNCAEKSFDGNCQASISFPKPVKSVTITYTNGDRIANNASSGRQGVELKVDNYCYEPPINLSGSVFNDNGGINAQQANRLNADITSAPYNSTTYFNGLLDSNESRINGSTVSLVSCSTPSKVYATQTLTDSTPANLATVGKYSFNVLQSELDSQSSICIIESDNSAYPIRTTISRIPITLIPATFNYPDNNFGRVIAENVALVLEKEQFANDCNLPNLTDTSVAYSKAPLGQTSSGSGKTINPNQCIAYKLKATNRSNLTLDSIIIRDELQKKTANVPSLGLVLARPDRVSTDNVGYSDGIAYGSTGIIISNPFALAPKQIKSFYFNTKYGSTQTP